MSQDLAAFVHWFRTCAPYIHAFRGKTFVIAFGGEVVEGPEFWNLVADINLLASLGIRLVLVHGSRPQIESMLGEHGVASRYVNGARVTDRATLSTVIEAAGMVRARIEAALSTAVNPAPVANHRLRVVGGNYIMAKPIGVIEGTDLQFAGEVRRIDADAIRDCLATGDVVLLSSLGYSATGEIFNLTFEDVATQAAIALKADKLIFMIDTDGVVDAEGKVITELYTREANTLAQADWQTSDIKTYLPQIVRACQKGVARGHLVNERNDGSILMELFTRDGIGTMVTIDSLDNVRAATIDDVGGILSLIEPLEEQGVLVKRPRNVLEQEIHRFFVAVHDGRIVGCAAMFPFPDDGEAEVACVAVNPEYRREGYGERLLKVVEKAALAEGMHTLFALTTRTAHWFIERGFVHATIADLPPKKQQLYNYQRMSQVYTKALKPNKS